MDKDRREVHRKLRILRHAEETEHINKTCRYFGVGRSSFYRWRAAYRRHGYKPTTDPHMACQPHAD